MRNRNTNIWLRGISILFVSVAIVMTAVSLVDYSRQRNNYPPGMTIAGVPVGGLEPGAASQRLLEVYTSPVEAHYGDAVIQIDPGVVGFRADVESMLAAADLVRTGGEDTSARLRELASVCDSPLVSARARHVAALRSRDATELANVASDFEAMGAMLLAAEAASGAGEEFDRAGDRRAAAAVRRRSTELADACEGAATPALFHARPAVPLSGREREIVRLAAAGLASKEIADRLFLSVRTVNNHLQHAYTKLGVSSRAGLAEALGSPA